MGSGAGQRAQRRSAGHLLPGAGRADRPVLPWPGLCPRPGLGPGAASSATLGRAAGVVGLLTTAADRRVDWVNVGQALQRILLTASACGAAVALHTQPIERPGCAVHPDPAEDGAYPHLVLRSGIVILMAVSVRRDPDDVLFPSGGDQVSTADEPRPGIDRFILRCRSVAGEEVGVPARLGRRPYASVRRTR